VDRVNHAAERSALGESELQLALDCGELIRLYQPIVDARTGAVEHVEALLRWDHPARGLLAPREFLVGEDDAALLVRIGWSVVIEAARRAGEWRRAFPHRPIAVSVNVFDEHLALRDLPSRVQQLLENNLVPGSGALAFEVGERHLRQKRSRTSDRLTMLRNLGVQVVVDDFGLDAASRGVPPDELRDWALEELDSIRSFPLDIVKFSPDFVAGLAADTRIAEAVDAAHGVGLRVIAVEVEDLRTAVRARDTGFDLAQGYHFARPEPPHRIDELLAAR
jgi:EAL domain-containing protein (putative c-di-GMP-specific phosphodiesterase class I)